MTFVADKALTSRVVILTGDEEALRRRALSEMVELANREGDFDIQFFEADETPPIDWIASAGTAPFLSEHRTVVVRHICRRDPLGPKTQETEEEDSDSDEASVEESPKLKTSKASASKNETKSFVEELIRGLKGLPESALLILVADEESGDEGKQRKFTAKRKAWEKVVKDAGGMVATFSTDPKALKETIKKEADRLGAKISDLSADRLAEMTGSNLSRSIEELEKLVLYVGAGGQIREADLRAVVVPSREWNVYKLIEAIIDGAVPQALRQLRILVGSPTKAEEAAFSRILPTMSRQLRLMWQARLCFEAKCSPEDAPEKIRRLFPEKPNLAKEHPFGQSRLMKQARRVDFPALQECFQAVSKADSKLKGLLDSFSAIETLELMVLEMVEVAGPKPAVR